jgi:hypothetical protein
MSRTKIEKRMLDVYRNTTADLRRILMLADIAAEAGNVRRAAHHVTSGLEELRHQLAELRAEAQP